ncbi:MAG: hypothetical protein ACREQQ_05925 [Candidatus Binatia bacterium]
MTRPTSPAQIAAQVTFLLKGHLKNARIAYIRAAVMLARVRHEKLWQALRYRSLAEYAEKQLRLHETTLYKYLRVHDWLKEKHPSWLAKRPKGFIPELSDVESLGWIEKQLENGDLDADLREDLEAAQKQALQGTLSYREFVALRARARKVLPPLRSLLGRTRALRKAAARVARVPRSALEAYDEAIRTLEAAVAATEPITRLRGLSATTLARLGDRASPSVVV